MIGRDRLYRLSLKAKQFNYWLTAKIALGAMRVLRLLPPDRAINLAGRLARRVGPILGRHRVALDNLRQAFPERSKAEIDAIAADMWENMARLAAEYVFLDQLFDYDLSRPNEGRIVAHGIPHFETIAGEDRPHILFTGHIGNFELLPVAGAAYGMKVSSLFRPPNNPYIADFINRTRSSTMGELVPSRGGVSIALARMLEANGTIGLLVDQKFAGGVATTFFGRPCETSPLLAKLARQFEWRRLSSALFATARQSLPIGDRRQARSNPRCARSRRHHCDVPVAERHGRALDPRRSRAVDVVSQALEDHGPQARILTNITRDHDPAPCSPNP